MATKKTDEQKLSSLSRKSIIVSQTLFIIFLIISILPWFIPNTSLGGSLLGIFGVQNFSTRDFGEIAKNFTILNRILGIGGSLVSLLPLLIGTLILIKLSKNYIAGKVFTIQNAKLYQTLGIIYLCDAFLIKPLSDMLISLCITLNNPIGQRMIMISFGIDNLTAIFLAVVLIVIGQIMKLGHKIKEEQEHFI
ncbi:MAG: DUF2975 domain-containing protein [Neisseriaceae bacterium]